MKKTPGIFTILLLASTLIGQESKPRDSISQIQLCLLLDVSGSMDGLLSQAQNEIWKTISFLEGFEKDSLETVIEIAMISYGNKNYAENGHVKLLSVFTTDIDQIAEKLLLMETGGGQEYCGQAIKNALDSLSWGNDRVFKCMIIAGNEPFDQGAIKFEASISLAQEKGILVNTIYCGERGKGIYENWEAGALLGQGSYTNIDQEISMDEFKTPYDHSLVQFYYDYKSTYLDEAQEQKSGQSLDVKGEISPAFRDMLIYKFGKIKKEKDLIDKFNDSNWQMNEFDDREIPEQWRALPKNALKFKLLEYARKRNTYAEGFESYTRKVEDFLRITVQPKLGDKTLTLALREMMSAQLVAFGFKEKVFMQN